MSDKWVKESKLHSTSDNIPIISQEVSKILCEEIFQKTPNKILEIGTGYGYSTSIIYEAINSKGFEKFVSIEKREYNYFKAKKIYEENCSDKRIHLINDDAKSFLKNAVSTGDQKFDFIFLDGPKGQYIKYYETILKILDKEGVLFVDNLYFNNYVFIEDESKWPKDFRTIIRNLRKFLKIIKSDDRIDVNILDKGDGIAIIKK